MSVDKTPTEISATPDQIHDLSEKLVSFVEALDENNQVMASTLLSLADDYRVRERLGDSDPDESEDDVQGFGMTVNSTQGALFESTDGYVNTTSRPIVISASGTAQVNRAWSLMERMGEAGCLDRVQSAILYDINSDTKRRIATKAQDFRSRQGTQIFQPEYIPSDDGFHRDPHGYAPYAGRLFQEQENLVESVSRRADQLGTVPQLIVHFIGFGSHSILGAKLHGQLIEEFPDAKTVIILGIPRDPTLHDQMKGVWDEFRSMLPADQCFLITDDRIGDPISQDHKLACAIASIEASSQSASQSGPTLPDVIGSLSHEKDGEWLGITSIKSFELPMTSSISLFPPFRRTKLIRGKSDELSMLPIKAIKAVMNDRWQIADHRTPDNTARSMIVCTVPLKNDELPHLNAQVQNLLSYDGFFEKYPRTTVTFASAQMPSNVVNRQIPNLPKRRNFLIRWAISPVKALLSISSDIFVKIAGKKPKPLHIHCSRIYSVPGADNPTQEIGTLSTILRTPTQKNGNQESSQQVEAWTDAVDDILREQSQS
jgi:hypothetical protein